MKSVSMFTIAYGVLGSALVLGQIQPAGQRSGPGVQAAQDEREPEVLKTCKTAPPPRGGRGAPARGPAPANPQDNADGIVAPVTEAS